MIFIVKENGRFVDGVVGVLNSLVLIVGVVMILNKGVYKRFFFKNGGVGVWVFDSDFSVRYVDVVENDSVIGLRILFRVVVGSDIDGGVGESVVLECD